VFHCGFYLHFPDGSDIVLIGHLYIFCV
jgi:hypothetical protein